MRAAETETKSPYLTYEQAAAYCNLERTSLWRAVRAGKLRRSGHGSAVRFHVGDLDRFMRGETEE
jgi:excisionase family DNA binding protein